jgi:hypothetical protein
MLKKISLILIITSSTFLFSMVEIKRSPEELAEIKSKILEETKKHQEDFNHIRDKKENIILAWREMVAITLPISKSIVPEYGYPATYAGTQKFTLDYILAQADKPELAGINEALYNFLYLQTFGVTGETKVIPQEEARDIVKQAAQNVDTEQSKEELKKIKEIPDQLEKIIAGGVFTYQLAHEAAEKFGFSKEDIGFIDVQRALTPHYADSVIMQITYAAIYKIYQAIGVDFKAFNS